MEKPFKNNNNDLQPSVPKRDIAQLIKEPLPGIFAYPVEEDITRLNAMVVGPFDTPYEGGFFHFHMR